MTHPFFSSKSFRRTILSALVLSTLCLSVTFGAPQAQRGPSDVVREFYKAMRERRFKAAFALTIYKPAVEGLSDEEMEDLRPTFEQKAAQVPAEVEITGEQISKNIATVFVKVPVAESTPQVTSEPINLINSNGVWIIGTEADQADVKKAGRRFFLDALIEGNHSDIEELLKRLLAVQIAYNLQHNGMFADLATLVKDGLVLPEVADPKSLGYIFHVEVSKDRKTYVASAEPTRYGRTGKLSFWMDQTGAMKRLDNGGKPVSASQ